MTDAELGAALRRAGLTPRAVAAAYGTELVARWPAPPTPAPADQTPAAAILGMLVAGGDIPLALAERGLGVATLAALVARGVVAVDGDRARARAMLSILPVGPSLIACDASTRPDDSSHHLIGCLPPARVRRWLDAGTGCAVAPLTRPDRATEIVAGDVDPRAVAHARLGVALSGVRHVDVVEADLTAGTGDGFDLVTFNLPIPAEAGLTTVADPRFRHAPAGADLLARFVAEVPARLAPGGTVVVHVWDGPPTTAIVDALPGEVTAVRYTPAGVAPFAVVRWCPTRPAARHRGRRALTAAEPHLTWADLDAAASH